MDAHRTFTKLRAFTKLRVLGKKAFRLEYFFCFFSRV